MRGVGDPDLEPVREALAAEDWTTAEALLPPLDESASQEVERLHHELDVGRAITEKYNGARESFAQGSHGETLRLLSEISILNPRFVDRENLRVRAAEALTIERRDHLYAQVERRIAETRRRADWQGVQPIVADLTEQLVAENLTLSTAQRAKLGAWSEEANHKLRQPKPNPMRATRSGPTAPVQTAPVQTGHVQTPPPGPRARPKPSSGKRPSAGRRFPWRGQLLGALISIGVAVAFFGLIGGNDNASIGPDIATGAGDPEPTEEDTSGDEPIDNTTDQGQTPGDPIAMLRDTWREERGEIITELRDGGFGLGEDGVVTGPGGFSFDTSACPSDWDETAGIEDGVVRIAHIAPLSGGLAAYRVFGDGMIAYFEQLNAMGGIGPDGLQVDLTIHDDGYAADRTIEVVDQLLAQNQPFAVNTLGTPGALAVYDTLNDACVPHPMVLSSHPAFGDVETRPWSSGLAMTFSTEAWLWGDWIERNVPEPVTVVGFVMDNDFGLTYEQSFEQFVETSEEIETVTFLRHDPVAFSFTDLMEVAIARNPTVVILMTAGNPCLQIIGDAAATGLTDTTAAMITPSVCADVGAYVAPAGQAADGWRVFRGGVKSTVDPEHIDDPYIAYVRRSLEDAGLDPDIAGYGDGFGFRAWSLHQILEIAANLDGGLTRTNLLLAKRSLLMTHPMLIDGISFGARGANDPYFIEGSDVSRYDAASQSWITEGVIDLDGATPQCRWVNGVGCN